MVLSETLELSKQNAERWEEVHGIKPVVLKGRRVEGMCISKSYDRIARKVEDAGQSPSRVCSKCPKRARCPFMEQSRELAVGVPTFGQTAHATTRFSANSEIGGAVVVFDESPAGVITKGAVTQITIAAIETLKQQARCVTAEGATLWGVEADRRDAIDKVVSMIGAAEADGRVAFSAIRYLDQEHEYTERKEDGQKVRVRRKLIRTSLKLVREWLNSARGEVDVIGEILVETQVARQYGQREALYEKLQIAGKKLKALREVERILTQCRENLFVDNQIAGAHEHVLGLAARKNKEEAPAVTIMLRPPIPVPLSHAEVVVLDGTGNPDQYKALFAPGRHDRPLNVIDIEAEVPPEGYRLTQYASAAFSKTKLLTDAQWTLKDAARFIIVKAAEHKGRRKHDCKVGRQVKDVLVVCQLPVEEALEALGGALEIPSNVEIRHFNDIRGLNHFKDVPCIIPIGRAKEPEQDTEDLAEAMAVRDPKVIVIQRQAGRDKAKAWADRKGRRTLAMTGGRKASVPCEAHPDPTVNQYMGRAGEEVLQAVNRIRAYDRTAASCCDVHVFGQFDTGLQVHEVCTQRDSEVDVFDLMRAQGVVLEGGESIEAAFPGWVGGGGQGRAMLAVSKRRIRTWAEERYEIRIGASTSRLPIERLHIGSRDNERHLDQGGLQAPRGTLLGGRARQPGALF